MGETQMNGKPERTTTYAAWPKSQHDSKEATLAREGCSELREKCSIYSTDKRAGAVAVYPRRTQANIAERKATSLCKNVVVATQPDSG